MLEWFPYINLRLFKEIIKGVKSFHYLKYCDIISPWQEGFNQGYHQDLEDCLSVYFLQRSQNTRVLFTATFVSRNRAPAETWGWIKQRHGTNTRRKVDINPGIMARARDKYFLENTNKKNEVSGRFWQKCETWIKKRSKIACYFLLRKPILILIDNYFLYCKIFPLSRSLGGIEFPPRTRLKRRELRPKKVLSPFKA